LSNGRGIALFILDLFSFLPYAVWRQAKTNASRFRGGKTPGDQNMNTAGQIAVTLAALVGFGRIFLADEGASHRLSGCLILAGLVGKIALSI
jgi:hypothetical protein